MVDLIDRERSRLAGERLTPTHANKKGMRYRYYVSKNLVRGDRSGSGWRLPAGDLEKLVEDWVSEFLSDDGAVYDAVTQAVAGQAIRREILTAASDLAARWKDQVSSRRRAILSALLARIVVKPDGVDLMLRPGAIKLVVGDAVEAAKASGSGVDHPEIQLHVAAKLGRASTGNTLVIKRGDANGRSPDPVLMRLLTKAYRYRELLISGEAGSIQELANREGISRPYVSAVVRLGFLAPQIVEAIVSGDQPEGLTAKRLLQCASLPAAWSDQREMLGFH